MANSEQLWLLKKGAKAWNQWRKEHSQIRPDLSRADLSGADLRLAELGRVDLNKALLIGARLREVELSWANLNGAELGDAELTGANLGGAVLDAANLTGADLIGANLFGSDFSNSVMGYNKLGNIDLSQVKGLETVRHLGPSIIGIDTIFRSQIIASIMRT